MSGQTQEFLSQFGDKLYCASTKTNISTVDALSGKKYICLYFSAHWCPPCRKFTPMLISLYNQLKHTETTKDFELVYISLDRTQNEYDDYTSTMPWKCIPYSDTNGPQRQQIAMKYGAQGIPHLVILDGADNNYKVITDDGTTEVQMDPTGRNFPWIPKQFGELWPKQILTKSNGLVDSSTLNSKYLMCYFSAHWCPPCKQFTPKLCQAYKTMKQERSSNEEEDFELVFVSSDRDVNSFNNYWGEMPFCALPFEDRDAKQSLSKLFDIKGIPSLLMLGPVMDDKGNRPLINNNLRSIIDAGDYSEFPFYPKKYQDLALGADGINDYRSLVIFCEGEDDDEQKEIIDAIKTVAEKKTQYTDHRFFYCTQPSGISTQIRKLLKIENKMHIVVMVLLDIPDNGGFYMSNEHDNITPETIEKFLTTPGERKQLSR